MYEGEPLDRSMQTSDSRQAPDSQRALDLELAAFLRKHREEIVQVEVDEFIVDYPDSRYNSANVDSTVTREMSCNTSRRYIDVYADELESGIINASRYRYYGGDMARNVSPTSENIVNFIDGNLIQARFIAHFLYQEYYGDTVHIGELYEALSRYVHRALEANIATFVNDEISEDGIERMLPLAPPPSYASAAAQALQAKRDRQAAGRPSQPNGVTPTPNNELPESVPGGQAPGAPARDDPLDSLTARERDVALLVAKGLSNAELAGRLGMSQGNVRNTLSHVFAKLDVHSRTELALLVARSISNG